MKSYVITKEGAEKMRAELDELKNVRRLEIAARIAKAKEQGDLSENAEYHDAKDAMAFLEGRVMELADYLAHATVSMPTDFSVVNVGCKVKVEVSGKEKEYLIVGPKESAPLAVPPKISNESPIGNALMGRKKGEEFEHPVTKGACKIIDIFC